MNSWTAAALRFLPCARNKSTGIRRKFLKLASGSVLSIGLSVWAEETVCFAKDVNFLAECGVCPPGSEKVSGPNQPKPGCKVKEFRDPRVVDQDEAFERMKARNGVRGNESGYGSSRKVKKMYRYD